jgi:L-fuconolactonase
MAIHSYRPSRRTFLQSAAAGLVLGPALGARTVAANEPTLAAGLLTGAAVPAGFSIVDAHIHLWDLSVFPVPWVAGNPILNQSYVLQDYKDQAAGLGIGGIVYVQAAWANEYSLLEADYVAHLARHDHLVQGMVAYAPLEYGDQVRVYLDSLMTRGPIIKGIRRGLPNPADSKFDMDRFIKGIRILPEYELSFDVLGKGTPHLDMAITIAQRAPDTSLILDHLLKPDIGYGCGRAAQTVRRQCAELLPPPAAWPLRR